MEITEDKNQWTGDRGINFTHSEQQRENKLKKEEKKKKKNRAAGSSDRKNKGSICKLESQKERKNRGAERIFKKVIAENFPSLAKTQTYSRFTQIDTQTVKRDQLKTLTPRYNFTFKK